MEPSEKLIGEHPHHGRISDSVLDYIADFKWSSRSPCPFRGSHTSFLSGLAASLPAECKAYPEYTIKIPKDKRINTLYLGKLDMYATYGKEKLALEFDSKFRLRYKSILKLLLSDANVCFAIYGGASYPPKFNTLLYFDNLCRINHIRKRFQMYRLGKLFYLVNLSNKKSKLIYV